MDGQDMLKRLAEDDIRNLWVVYHDYNGRGCAKTVPAGRFETTVYDGLVFARANLDFALNDHMAPDGMFQAETGDFLAVPDPDSYFQLPYLEHTALVHCFMLTEEHEPFAGCPRSALRRMAEGYTGRQLQPTVALERGL